MVFVGLLLIYLAVASVTVLSFSLSFVQFVVAIAMFTALYAMRQNRRLAAPARLSSTSTQRSAVNKQVFPSHSYCSVCSLVMLW